MYPEAVPMLQPYVKMWKVRYKDKENLEILKLIYSSGKKVLISTDKVGAHPNAYYLFCVPEYPPKSFPSPDCFKGFDGYSCHIPIVSHIASAVGEDHLDYLEVHAMLDEYDNYEPIDQKVSLTISDLSKLVRLIKGRKIDVISHTDSHGTRTIYTGGLLDDPNFWV
jgi:sialic acid synthase SpsE